MCSAIFFEISEKDHLSTIIPIVVLAELWKKVRYIDSSLCCVPPFHGNRYSFTRWHRFLKCTRAFLNQDVWSGKQNPAARIHETENSYVAVTHHDFAEAKSVIIFKIRQRCCQPYDRCVKLSLEMAGRAFRVKVQLDVHAVRVSSSVAKYTLVGNSISYV